MKPIERVMAAVTGGDRDRVPSSLVLSLYGAKLAEIELRDYYTDSEMYLEGQRAIIESFNPDIVLSPFALALEGDAFGSQIKFFPHQPPNVIRPRFQNIKDILPLDMPSFTNGSLDYILSSISKLSEHIKGERALATGITAPIDIPALIMGIDNWIEILLFNQRLAFEVLEFTTEYFVEYGNRMLDNGANFLVSPIVFCNPKIATKKIMDTYAFPTLKKAFARIKGPIVFHHGGNNLIPILDEIKGFDNVIGFALGNTDSFSKAREILGDSRVLLGNILGPTLSKLTPYQIKNLTKEILDDRKDDRHFIFLSSGADIPWDTSNEQIMKVFETVREY